MVPGSPYLTFNYAKATPLITSGQGAITAFNGTALATGAKGQLNNIFFYRVFTCHI